MTVDQAFSGSVDKNEAGINPVLAQHALFQDQIKTLLHSNETGPEAILHGHPQGLILKENGNFSFGGQILQIIFTFGIEITQSRGMLCQILLKIIQDGFVVFRSGRGKFSPEGWPGTQQKQGSLRSSS